MVIFASPLLKSTCPDGGIGRRAGLKHQWIQNPCRFDPGSGYSKNPQLKLGIFLWIIMAFVYIIYSKRIDKYYVGSTVELEKRLLQHNTGFYTDSYTDKTNDWALYYCITCENITQAIKIEKHIKRMKSRKYLNHLREHPEITTRLLAQYG